MSTTQTGSSPTSSGRASRSGSSKSPAQASRTPSSRCERGRLMRLALAHARAETLQLLRYPAYVAADTRASRPLVAVPRSAVRARRARAAAGGVRRDRAPHSDASSSSGSASPLTRTTPWESYLRTLARRRSAHGWRDECSRPRCSRVATLAVVTVVAIDRLRGVMPARGARSCLVVAARGRHSVRVPRDRVRLLAAAAGGCRPSRTSSSSRSRSAVRSGRRPTDEMPREVDLASQLLPTRSWMEILDSIATGDSPLPWHHVAALAAWGAAFFGARLVGLPSRRGRALPLRAPTRPSEGAPPPRPRSPGAGSPSPRDAPRSPPPRPRARPPGRRSPATGRSRRAPRAPRHARARSSVPSASRTARRLRDDLRVEAERRGQAERVHRALRQAVPAAEHLRHRVREAETRSPRARVPRGTHPRGGACDRRSRAGFADDEWQRVADRGRARVGVPLRTARAGRVVVRLGAVRERVQRRPDGHVERKVDGQLGVVDRPRSASRARPSRRDFVPGSSSIPKNGVHSAPAYVVGTATILGSCPSASSASAATTALQVSIALPPPRPTRPSASTARASAARLADGLDRNVRPARRRSCRRRRRSPARAAPERVVTSSGRRSRLGADVVERLDRAGAETDDPSGRLGRHVDASAAAAAGAVDPSVPARSRANAVNA